MSVHWIIDTTISRSTNPMRSGSEHGYDDLIKALERTETPYTLVKAVPMTDKLIPAEWDTFRKEEPPELNPQIDGPVFVTGIMSMKLVCARRGWNPGYIDAPGQDELIEHWGTHVLNHGAVIGPFAEVEPPSRSFFARPVADTKSFAGCVYTDDPQKPELGSGRDQWRAWVAQVMAGQDSYTSIRGDDLVMLAPLKNIYAEYRLYVVGGHIVTGSRYKLGGDVFYTTDLDPAMLDFARARLREYCPRDVLCLDIAHVEGDEPYKVIETNSISSSGFYACDMNIFVNAINMYFGEGMIIRAVR